MRNHGFAQLLFTRGEINYRAYAVALPDLCAQGAEALCRPALRFPAAPWAHNNIAFGALASQLFAELADFLRRDVDGELHFRGPLRAGMQSQAHAHICNMLSYRCYAFRVEFCGAAFARRVSITTYATLRA